MGHDHLAESERSVIGPPMPMERLGSKPGWLSTRIQAGIAAQGRLAKPTTSPGNNHDIAAAETVLDGLEPRNAQKIARPRPAGNVSQVRPQCFDIVTRRICSLSGLGASAMCPRPLSRYIAGLLLSSFAVFEAPGLVLAQPAPKAGDQPASASPSPPLRRSDEREAVRLLVDAEAELAQGDPRVAVRLLELMIARFPATLAAERARARIAALRALPIQSKPAVPAQIQPQSAGTGAAPAGVWRTRVRPIPSAAEAFRKATGDRVFFAERSSELGGRARVVLAAQARWLKLNPAAPVVIEAHADDPGTPAENLELAVRRGEAVRRRLVEEGVAAGRIRVAVIGQKAPTARCPEAICAAQNRRAVTLIAVRSPLETMTAISAGTLPPEAAAQAGRPSPLPGINGLGGPAPAPAPR